MGPSKKNEPIPDLSRSEIEVLKPLWTTSPLSAREIHDAISPRLGWAYTTTRTTLDRLVAKRHVARRKIHGIHVFEARVKRVTAMAGMVREFASSVLEVDPHLVVPLFAEGDTLTEEELDELERILKRKENRP